MNARVPHPGEPTLAVAMPQLPHHPCARLAGHATEADGIACLVLDHDLHPSAAQQPASGLRVDRGA
ncbi:MAG: hypothetical protein ACXVQU_11065, partial [Actinomycetota bacterium]